MNSYQASYICEGDGIILSPAVNYVNYFRMANGTPLDDPNSGFPQVTAVERPQPSFL